MIKVGIIGAAGYTAGELIRILVHHPEVQIDYVQSESQVGKKVYDIHKDLIGDLELTFTGDISSEVDVVFICKGHGESRKVLVAHPELYQTKVIDLSQDFRLAGDHEFVYGLPEANAQAIGASKYLANPGCFATAIQLSLLPAVADGLITGDIHISGITGSTGAGQSFSETSHFSWRNNNASVYKPFTHQHLNEIGETFVKVNSGFDSSMHFIPYRGAFTRGIIITSYFETSASEEELNERYNAFYEHQVFTHVIDQNPDLKMVINTNKGVVYPTVIEGRAMIVSVIDNLLKGASGQAVHNMNLMFDLEPAEGLHLKPSNF
ncbi:MAG: N-acetyl-gamma-glutamyl-phosphate reductase [Bacteroidota bacterium]